MLGGPRTLGSLWRKGKPRFGFLRVSVSWRRLPCRPIARAAAESGTASNKPRNCRGFATVDFQVSTRQRGRKAMGSLQTEGGSHDDVEELQASICLGRRRGGHGPDGNGIVGDAGKRRRVAPPPRLGRRPRLVWRAQLQLLRRTRLLLCPCSRPTTILRRRSITSRRLSTTDPPRSASASTCRCAAVTDVPMRRCEC